MSFEITVISYLLHDITVVSIIHCQLDIKYREQISIVSLHQYLVGKLHLVDL